MNLAALIQNASLESLTAEVAALDPALLRNLLMAVAPEEISKEYVRKMARSEKENNDLTGPEALDSLADGFNDVMDSVREDMLECLEELGSEDEFSE